jgi:hypothetical protein
MPQAVIPFPQNFKSFVIANFVIIAVVRLVFVVLSASPRQPRWWKKLSTSFRTMQLDDIVQRLSIGERGRRLTRKMSRGDVYSATESMELPTVRV